MILTLFMFQNNVVNTQFLGNVYLLCFNGIYSIKDLLICQLRDGGIIVAP